MGRLELSGDRFTLAELAVQLSQAVGDQKAEAVVAESAKALGIHTDTLSKEQALDILERIADAPGLVGIAARFTRSRVMLIRVASTPL